MIKFTAFVLALTVSLTGWVATGRSALDQSNLKFDFGTGITKPGWQRVDLSAAYSAEKGFGFEGAPALSRAAGGVASDQPFAFSVGLPEGNYRVTATLGDGGAASVVTVKAESRRLMVEQVPVAAGHLVPRTFTVNIRTPKIPGHGDVKLNPPRKRPAAGLALGR